LSGEEISARIPNEPVDWPEDVLELEMMVCFLKRTVPGWLFIFSASAGEGERGGGELISKSA